MSSPWTPRPAPCPYCGAAWGQPHALDCPAIGPPPLGASELERHPIFAPFVALVLQQLMGERDCNGYKVGECLVESVKLGRNICDPYEVEALV